jgi:LuxR family maltose regulon positive regulatory protein
MPRVWRSDEPARGRHGRSTLPGARGEWWIPPVALQRLDRSPTPRLTLVSASAGSGKSRLVGTWLSSRPDRRWIWADFRMDDVSSRAALDHLTSWLAENQPPSQAATTAGAADAGLVMVLAGVEALDVDDLITLIEQLPEGARAVLISTGNPLPPGVAVDLPGEVDHLGPADLWWPPEAVLEYVTRLTGVRPADPECRALVRLTDGWPAGVIVLASVMRHRPAVLVADRRSPEPEILDFVSAAVLDALPADLREFVLLTSPVSELDPSTCAALVPAANPHAMLIDAHRYGLLNEERPFALRQRYRSLVRVAALRALRARDPAAEAALLRRAADQARRRGDEQDALSWFVESGDIDSSFAVLGTATADGLRGWDWVRLRETLTRIAPFTWMDDAQRRLIVAVAAALVGDRLLAIETIRRTPPDLVADVRWWTALSALVEALGGGTAGGRTAIRAIEALEVMADDQVMPAVLGAGDRASLIASAHILAARSVLFDDDRAVEAHLRAAWAVEGAQIPRYLLLAGLGIDALSAARVGELAKAQRVAARARQLAEQGGLLEHPMIGPAVLARVDLLRARGRPGEALAELAEAEPVLHSGEQFINAAGGGRPYTAAAQLLRVTLLLDLGDVDAAGRELAVRTAEGDDALPADLDALRALAEARLRLALDDVSAPERLLAHVPVGGAAGALRVAAALRRQAPEMAQRVLESWPAASTRQDGLYRLLARAALALALDRRPEAGECIQAALTAAEPDGHVQVFLDAPAALWPIIAAVLRRPGHASPWRTDLIRRVEQARAQTEPGDAPVTRRERVVLEHLARPLTHQQIAAALFVSENTLKSHCRNLYRKLGVNSRGSALAVARSRGWLPPEPQGDVVLNLDVTPTASAADVEL